jgi:hypothetical protein
MSISNSKRLEAALSIGDKDEVVKILMEDVDSVLREIRQEVRKGVETTVLESRSGLELAALILRIKREPLDVINALMLRDQLAGQAIEFEKKVQLKRLYEKIDPNNLTACEEGIKEAINHAIASKMTKVVEIARACSISPSHISNWRNHSDKRHMTPEKLTELYRYLGAINQQLD